MSESALVRRVITGLRGLGVDVQRLESPGTGAGVPDLSFAYGGVEGWVEFKYLAGWPKRPQTAVRLGVRPAQATWLESRGRSGSGACWVLAQVSHDYLLWHWTSARALAEGRMARELVLLGRAAWRRRLDCAKLLATLIDPP